MTTQHFLTTSGYPLRDSSTQFFYEQMVYRKGQFRINEIADEMGFSDESHLTRTFKKHRGISLAEFRRSVLAANDPAYMISL